MKKCLFLPVVLFCLGVVGCRLPVKVLPPVRPAAYMFPTVDSAHRLDECLACPVTVSDVKALLGEMGLYNYLQSCGMLESDVQLLARGLSARGYAELDARRSNGEVRWISFVCQTPPEIVATAAFSQIPPPETLGDLSPSVSLPRSTPFGIRTSSGIEMMHEEAWEAGPRRLVRILHADGTVSLWKLILAFRVERNDAK